MKITQRGNNLYLTDYGRYDMALTLDCGQAFRFSMDGNGVWHGIALGHELSILQKDDTIIFYGMNEDDFRTSFLRYFDFERDYASINRLLCRDQTLKKAISVAGGIHILRQEIWETLCSFIISQNNNIPRIKGIINRLCEGFGTPCGNGYAFPSADVIAEKTVEDLAPLRAGFRTRYILDAAKKISDGEIDIHGIETMPADEARSELKKIKGVGDKVANCVLLFAFGRVDVVPIDVWMKRALNEFYGGEEFPDFTAQYAGIAQQYLFYYVRTLGREEVREQK